MGNTTEFNIAYSLETRTRFLGVNGNILGRNFVLGLGDPNQQLVHAEAEIIVDGPDATFRSGVETVPANETPRLDTGNGKFEVSMQYQKATVDGHTLVTRTSLGPRGIPLGASLNDQLGGSRISNRGAMIVEGGRGASRIHVNMGDRTKGVLITASEGALVSARGTRGSVGSIQTPSGETRFQALKDGASVVVQHHNGHKGLFVDKCAVEVFLNETLDVDISEGELDIQR